MGECRPKEIEYFCEENGRCPFDDWIEGLDEAVSARIDARLRRVESGNMGDCHPLSDRVSELRVDFGPGYRVYFWQRGDYILILHAGKKDTQRRDIQVAKARLEEFLEDEDYEAQTQETP